LNPHETELPIGGGVEGAIGVIAVRDTRQMNGPGSGISASMRRHWVMNTSSWPHFVCASRWLRAAIFALFFRTAAISSRFWMIMPSRDD